MSGKMASSAEYLKAKEAWTALSAEHAILQERLDAARHASYFRANPPGPIEQGFSKTFHLPLIRQPSRGELIAAQFERDRPDLSDRQLATLIADLDDDLARARRRLNEAQASWEEAKHREATRIVDQFRPAHRKAIQAVAACVQSLSSALLKEADVRTAAEAEAGTQLHALPRADLEFAGTLADYASVLSAWGRRMRAEGMIP